jgi:hypothetical protein
VLTDREGHFAFTNVPRGRYTVWVQRFNYYGALLNGFPASTASATFTFDPAKPPRSVDLVMTKGMAITGRVLDPLGLPPPPGIPVTAYRAIYNEGKQQWAAFLSRPIDDRGEYRLSPLPPGDYFVGVTPPRNAAVVAGQNPSVRTFYPGVTEPFEATRITLGNRDVPGVDFSIRTALVSFHTISGFAMNPSAVPSPAGVVDNGFTSFALVPLNSRVIDNLSANTFPNAIPPGNRTRGEFEIRRVPPGVYEIYPVSSSSAFLAERTVVDVRTSDAPGVRVLVNPGVTLQGRVVAAGSNIKLESVLVTLKLMNAPAIREATFPAVPVDANGHFTVTGPAGTPVMLQVSGLPDFAFISDIRIGADSVFNNGFELSSSSEPIRISIDATNGATVDATVRTVDERPGTRARVVLIPTEDRRQNSTAYRVGSTDDDGRLTVRGVAPGTYMVFAWESVPDSAWLNKEFLLKYQDRGTAITVAPGARTAVQLKWIPF